MASKFRALGVHIFAGGFSIGVEKHFKLLGHLERSNFAVASWRRYRPNILVYIDRAATWASAIESLRNKVDFVYANPPCAPWSQSVANYGARGAASPLMAWTRDVMRVAARVEPRVVAIESVRGALTRGAEFYASLRDEFGWTSLLWILVNAVDHGLPQWRPRVFIVFTRDGVPLFDSPSVTRRTILESLADAPLDEPMATRCVRAYPGVSAEELVKCIPAISPGEQLHRVSVDRLRMYSEVVADASFSFHGHMLTRLQEDAPSIVVYSHAKLIHPREDRLLTLRELMRLTGYPDDFEFVADQHAALIQLGKTVCPPVGAWLACEVAAYLQGDRSVRYVREAVFEYASRTASTTTRQMTFEDM